MSSMKKDNKVKKKGKQKVVIEGIEPLNFQKLFAFCNPSKEQFDDSSTLASTPSTTLRPDLTPQQSPPTITEKTRSLPLEDGDGKEKASTPTEEGRPSTNEGTTKTTTTENNTTTTREIQPELKATHRDSKLRIRRGIEVAIFAVLVVWGTIVALHKLEGKVDFNVIVDSEFISSERKKLINVFHKKKDVGLDGEKVSSSPVHISAKPKKTVNKVISEAEETVADDAQSSSTTSTKPDDENKLTDGDTEPNELPKTVGRNDNKVNDDAGVDSLDEVDEADEPVETDPEQVSKFEEETVDVEDAGIRSDL